MLGRGGDGKSAQISFEFLVVYSFIVLVFAVIFLLVTSERASALNAQSYSALQLVAQDVAGYLDQAAYAGSGYNVSVPLAGSIGTLPYNITISTTGVVIVSSKIGTQIVSAYAFSSARNLIINGTYSQRSSNAVQLYTLPNTGVFQVSNLNNVLFVNRLPVSTSNLASSMYARVAGKSFAAVFNGVTFGYSPIPSFSSPLKAESFTAWIDPISSSEVKNTVLQLGGAYLQMANSGGTLICFYGNSPSGSGQSVCDTSNVPVQSFTFVAGTYNSVTGTENLYINGYLANTATATYSGSPAPASGIEIGTACTSLSSCSNPLNFNGLIANIQAYNATLSASQVSAIYSEGLSGAPITTKNVIAWYPLNGNMNDYSGDNYALFPRNGIFYQTIVQINAYPLSKNGTKIYIPGAGVGIPVLELTGFTSSAGVLGAAGAFNGSMANGIVSGFLNSNNAHGLINLTVTEFNGNNTLLNPGASAYNGLTVWFPLNSGYGNTVQDMGPYRAQLTATGGYNGFPGWVAANRNITNFQAAEFSGSSANILVGYDPAYTGIGDNGTYTAVAWVYYNGNDGNQQGIFGDISAPLFSASANGFELVANGATTGVMVVANSLVPWPSGSAANLPLDSWIMLTGEYNAANGLASVYTNESLFASNNVGQNLLITQPGPYLIGHEDWLSGSSGTYNGFVSDVQLYSTTLNQTQIDNLYSQGPTGTPIAGVGLLGWWPLDGGNNDFSAVSNQNSTIHGSVTFNNVQFANYSLYGPSAYALNFNPESANTFTGIGYIGFNGLQITVTAWVKPAAKQMGSNGIILATGPTACLSPVNSVDIGIQSSGLPFFAQGCNAYAPTNGIFITPNTWDFVAMRFIQPNVYFFINGKWTNGSIGGVASFAAATTVKMTIGGMTPTTAIFNGSVTDLQIYNTALPPQQIVQIYEQGIPPVSRFNLSVT